MWGVPDLVRAQQLRRLLIHLRRVRGDEERHARVVDAPLPLQRLIRHGTTSRMVLMSFVLCLMLRTMHPACLHQP